MLKIGQYIRVQDLDEAYELCQKRSSVVLGGMIWLKMQRRNVGVAIDLSDLNLDYINENEDDFEIGAMCSLRDLETHKGLNTYTNDAIKNSIESIVGVQFRNTATIGGSIFGKFGFSDLLTIFSALDAYVNLHKQGSIPIREFLDMPLTRDVLVSITVKKTPIKIAYVSQRNTKTDFPVLTSAISNFNNTYYVVLGARPTKAIAYECNNIDEETLQDIVSKTQFQDNNLASGKYREMIAPVLLQRTKEKL